MKANLPTSLGLSTLFNFYKRNEVPLGELAKAEDQFEQTGESQGLPLWTPKIGKSEDEIRVHNQTILEWVWNFRDYFWSHSVKQLGMTKQQAQAATKAAVAGSDALKLCGYFRNIGNHVELDKFKDYPAFETSPPRLGDVEIHHLCENGDTAYRTNFVGAEWAAVSTQFPFIQTVGIKNFPGGRDTRRVANEAAWEWIALLKTHGVDLHVEKPKWFKDNTAIEVISFGDTPKARQARLVPLPEGIVGSQYYWEHLDNPGIHLVGPF